jgi:uncharacterized protein YndB with AHSA1/START domain
VVVAEVDLRKGGHYRLGMRAPSGEIYTTTGVYQEVLPPERIVYTWRWSDPESVETLVTVEFKDLGPETEVTLRHERFVDAPHRDSHLQGWTGCLENLEQFFAARMK